MDRAHLSESQEALLRNYIDGTVSTDDICVMSENEPEIVKPLLSHLVSHNISTGKDISELLDIADELGTTEPYAMISCTGD